MARPKFKIAMARKDKSPVEYIDYQGQVKTAKTAPVLAIFEDDKGGYWVKVEPQGPLGQLAETHWFNIYDGGAPRQHDNRAHDRREFESDQQGDGDDIPF